MRHAVLWSVFLMLLPEHLALGREKTGPKIDAPSVFCLSPQALAKTKARIAAGDRVLEPALAKLLTEADKALKARPSSVMAKRLIPPSGDKHDYMSYGPYWWPNPKTKDGLPFVQRDGEINREMYMSSDAPHLQHMIDSVDTLAITYYLTGKKVYAERAGRLMRAWFLVGTTKMNPHLEYGQAIPGVCQGRGIGIIDTRNLGLVVDAIGLLKSSRTWTPNDKANMMTWFNAYLEWLSTSENGHQAERASNNIGTWYDVQRASLALFVGKQDLARRIVETSKSRRIKSQIEPDGRQPLELQRKASFGYSVMNLRALFNLAALGERVGVDLWHYESQDGRSIRKALDFLAPYADPAKPWPHAQIPPSEGVRSDLLALLRRAAIAYGDNRYEQWIAKSRKELVSTYRMQLLYSR